MSYQNYSDQPQQGYGQYNPYGQSGNPYTVAGNPYSTGHDAATLGGYDRPDMQHHGSSRYDEESAQGGYEMSSMNSKDPNRILNEVRQIDQAIDGLENELQRLRSLQRQYLADTDVSADSRLGREVNSMGNDIMNSYRGLVTRVKNLKQNPESGNPRNAPQVGKADRRLKTAINQYQQLDRDYRNDVRAQMERQYRIVRPDASEQEIREAVEDSSNTQVFSQALISSNRRGEAQRVAQNVRSRHEEIQKIERQMEELATLFQDLDALVVQQEAPVTAIEQKGNVINDDVTKANVELDGAVKKARSARKKKWICVGIGVLIIIVIVVVVVVVVEVTKN